MSLITRLFRSWVTRRRDHVATPVLNAPAVSEFTDQHPLHSDDCVHLCACSDWCRRGRPWEEHNCRACGTWSAPHPERRCPDYLTWLAAKQALPPQMPRRA